MTVRTAIEANVLLETKHGGLSACPITVHYPISGHLTQAQIRDQLLSAIETHYDDASVVSLMVSERTEMGKELVSLRRSPIDQRLEVNRVADVQPHFRLGGERIDVSFNPARQH